MRKLIMWNIITLDGYFEGDKNWDLGFSEIVWGPELEKISIDQLKSAGFLVFGRVTYEGMAAYWKTAKGEIAELMNEIPKLIFSRTLKSVDWNNSTLIEENASSTISKLKELGDGDLYVFGSANLSETFINDNLFDEYRIGIAPVIFGSGRHLFRKGIAPRQLTLVSSQQLSTGGVILTFKAKQIESRKIINDSKIKLRKTEIADLEFFFVFQLDKEANHLAAFTSKDPTDKTAYLEKYTKLVNDPTKNMQTIIVENIIAGSISKFEMEGKAEITYWIDKKFWGKGVATKALKELLKNENARPIFGRVAFDNYGSQKVLEKCGFVRIGKDKGFANARQAEIEEYIYKLT